MKKISKNLNWL